MKMINPLTGRGTAMLAAAPSMFAVAEVFHANPIVGIVVGGIAGMVAYRHWDDADRVIENLKEGTLKQYRTQDVDREVIDEISSVRSGKRSDKVATGDDIPIGKQQNGKTFARDLQTLKNILIMGLPGGGKTNTAIHIIKHAIRRGARIAVIDRHARASDDSLAAKITPWENAFICPTGADPVSSMTVINQVRGILDGRLEEGEEADFPLILVVDEYSSIMLQAKNGGKWENVGLELSGLIEDVLSGGRKAKIFCICIGQLTNASRTGGTEIRELFPTCIAHAMKARQANMLGFTEQNNLIPGLGRGEIFLHTEGMLEPVQLMIRYESDEDIEKEGSRIPEYEPIGFEERDTEELEELPDIPMINRPQKRRATLNDAIEVWNECGGNIGRPRLRKELQAKGLECSDDLAGRLLSSIKENMEA